VVSGRARIAPQSKEEEVGPIEVRDGQGALEKGKK